MWTPRSPFDEYDGLIWLPRMIEKARRYLQGRARNEDLMNGYMFGDNDIADKALLKFLRVDDSAVLRAVEAHPSDEEAAREIVALGGRSVEERQRFNASLKRKFFNFSLLEADEGRMPAGLGRTLLRLAYNGLVLPPAHFLFERAERRKAMR